MYFLSSGVKGLTPEKPYPLCGVGRDEIVDRIVYHPYRLNE